MSLQSNLKQKSAKAAFTSDWSGSLDIKRNEGLPPNDPSSDRRPKPHRKTPKASSAVRWSAWLGWRDVLVYIRT